MKQHLHAALELSDRAYVLRQGRLVLSGPSAGLRSRLSEVTNSYFDEQAATAQGLPVPAGPGQSPAAG